MLSQAPSFGGPVTLNVGGTLYATTLETLTRFPDSMLGAMFREGAALPPNSDPQGSNYYFIDRDGKAFRHILNFLRLGCLDLPRGYGETALLRAEADFYQIQPLLDALRELEVTQGTEVLTAALLHADVDATPRLVHFSARRGPHHYELSAAQVDTFRANIFCTDATCLGVLRTRFGVAEGEGGEGSPHFRLEWAPCPEGLPEVEYRRLGLQQLWAVGEAGEKREVVGTPGFLEEVLQVALEHGFRLDSVFPDPEDLLNSRSLRFVRH
ncbi:BTB/POZ domain-containing protein KCTD11 [Petaurus breviceps papuanus]|uniref:BTB/POZ domain-containing protein KCTD11 n=1 Tax=Petaurus breviceps papuanus TaxID=3040969 RepID=UPI0036D7ACE4